MILLANPPAEPLQGKISGTPLVHRSSASEVTSVHICGVGALAGVILPKLERAFVSSDGSAGGVGMPLNVHI